MSPSRRWFALSLALVFIGCQDSPVEVTRPDGPAFSVTSETEAFAYVTNGSSDDVSVIRTSDNTVVATVGVGTAPRAVAITPDGAFAYVTNADSDNVSVIRISDNTVVATVGVGTHPRGVAITPDGAFAYVANWSSDLSVSVIRTSDNTLVTTVELDTAPIGVAITPDGAFAYVTNMGWNSVSVIRTSDNAVVATVELSTRSRGNPDGLPGSGPVGIAFTPDGAFAYVANMGSNNVSVIRTSDNTLATAVGVGTNPVGVAITPDGAVAYVANHGSHNVSVIRTSDNAVAATVWVGASPFGVAITPDGAFAYVTNSSSHSVSVIRTSDNAVIATVGVGTHPGSVAITPPPEDVANTPAGSNVVVNPLDAAPVSLTFGSVTSGGETTVASGQVGSPGSPPAPSSANFRLGNPPTFYDIQTTADFEGTITVCITYDEGEFRNTKNLKLLHFDENEREWEVLPNQTVDEDTRTVCGETTSLSPFLVAEPNEAPVVTGVSLTGDPVPVGTATLLEAAFTDANPGDVHSGTFDWGAGAVAGTVVESAGAGTLSLSQAFAEAGVFTVTATVSDGDLDGSRSSAQDVPSYLVVYDPSGSFVTGGGWIDSPAGACTLSTCTDDTTGKASFGFVSRYKKGATTPSGNTEFQFKAAELNFKGSNYDWLVVAGARAQFKGSGQINGSGDYGFLLTAIDGDVNGGGGVDRFRIKIWDRVRDEVVYDNQRGQGEASDATTELGGGSIRIHK